MTEVCQHPKHGLGLDRSSQALNQNTNLAATCFSLRTCPDAMEHLVYPRSGQAPISSSMMTSPPGLVNRKLQARLALYFHTRNRPAFPLSMSSNSVWDRLRGGRCGLLSALSENLFQSLLLDGYPLAGSLGHLLRHFRQVHSHSLRILQDEVS